MDCAARGIAGTPCSRGLPARRCGICGAVAYCSREHQILHWSTHKEECERLAEQMKRANILNDFPFEFSTELEQENRCSLFTSKGLHHARLWQSECSCGLSVVSTDKPWLTDEWSLPSLLCPCTEPDAPLSSCLTSWKDYYHWRCLPFHSPVSMLLHWPLTVYHSLQLSVAQSLIPEIRDELHIHYIGPEKELSQLAVFGELRALFPSTQLHIQFIGPAVPHFRDGEVISLCNYLPCADENCHCKFSCKVSGSSSIINVKLHRGLYHETYGSLVKESYPQLIIAPNAGIAAYSSWSPTIELIKEMGVPAIFTDFCEEAANLAASCISSVTGLPLKLPVQLNPFRQPMVVENSALYLPCYSNCFIFGM